MPPAPQLRCKRGHDDWVIADNGFRRCRTCQNIPSPNKRIKQNKGSHEEETFTLTEILQARGYVSV